MFMLGWIPAKLCDAACTAGMSDCIKQNVIVEWSALLFRIQEMPSSNPGQETGCRDCI
jgi:hypothetical protein